MTTGTSGSLKFSGDARAGGDMSEVPQGDGWWVASDGRWYPPELHPRRRRPPPRTLAGDLATAWRWFRARRAPAQALIGVGVIVLVAAAAGAITGDDSPSVETVGASTSVAERADEATTTTTTAAPVLPDGDDRTVTTVIDGDSFAVDDGTSVRLIGVNTPEVETGDCFSAEATLRQRELIGAGTRVRLAYDQQRTDRFGRTLAYVYRLPDGLFVNLTLARDGFAREQTVPPNTSRAHEFQRAVAEARAANRGLWSACETSTTTTARVTTSAPPTTRAAVAASSTTRAAVPATTSAPPTTRAVVAAPSSTLQAVSTTGGCHPSYAGACIPYASDVDCAPGSGNGPAYTYANNFRVVGPDVYGLDSDNTGSPARPRWLVGFAIGATRRGGRPAHDQPLCTAGAPPTGRSAPE